MEKPCMRSGLYYGLVTEVAKALEMKQPTAYWAIFTSKRPNAAKDMFVRLKKERDERNDEFNKSMSISKAS
jgi:hypothetical protein